MNKGVFVVLILSIWIPIGTIVFRHYFEQWLYKCQSTSTGIVDTWKNHGLPNPKRFQLHSPDTIVFEYPNATCRIFYFHGRGRTLAFNYYFLGPLFHNTRCSIVAFEYPTSPYTDREMVFENARLVVYFGISNYETRDFLMCSSMGCSVLLKLLDQMLEYPTGAMIRGVVLENPPTSLSKVASFHTNYWVPSFLIRSLIGEKNDWEVSNVFKHKCKILLFTSERDELVPASMGCEIAKEYGKTNSVTHVILERANHGDAPSHPKYQKAIKDFILE